MRETPRKHRHRKTLAFEPLESRLVLATILGTGTGALLGGDLTDPEDDGAADANVNYNATFFSSDEPGFGGGEFAFNVFDNTVGGGNAKWCCGTSFPQIVGAVFDQSYLLTHFTLTSGNDTVTRDPRVWQIQGSNDSTTGLDGTWTNIYSRTDANSSDWTARNQVISYTDSSGDGDFPTQTAGYTSLRLNTDATGLTGGAFHALAEFEIFGIPIPEPSTLILAGLGLIGVVGFGRRRRVGR